MSSRSHNFNCEYTGENLARVAFPLGGIGAGMICVEGSGALSHVSLRHAPDVQNEPSLFSAICIKGSANTALVLEGPVPTWKAFGIPGAGNGGAGRTYGLPRFATGEFLARFPFAHITAASGSLPVDVRITAWSPFVPGDADASSLPVAALEYTFANHSDSPVDAVYSFNAANFMATGSGGEGVRRSRQGFIFFQPGSDQKPADEGAFCAEVDAPEARVNCSWFRGGWFDPLTMAWKAVEEGDAIETKPPESGAPSPGASICVPFRLGPHEQRTIRLRLCWFVPQSNLRIGGDGQGSCEQSQCYRPWYVSKFADITDVAGFWRGEYQSLRERTQSFSDCFYDTTLPPEMIEAAAANLSILKSPTVLRQEDGRLWAWEGCSDREGCCHGSCTHVWNYAQALPHLFPDLERTLRETEFRVSQDDRGHQSFRSDLPVRPPKHDFHAAADGQLGGIMKVYRDWRISGDTGWLRGLWPQVKQSLDYCTGVWDPRRTGLLEEPHHNTYDIEFWGPDGMCASFYLGALWAAVRMAGALGEDATQYSELLRNGRDRLESDLFNGEYFVQRIRWDGLNAKLSVDDASLPPEAAELMRSEGPKYQYGGGCLSDGVLGAWMAAVCGLPEFLDSSKVKSSLQSIHRYNCRPSLAGHANPQRPTYAFESEGGLLLCSWPSGGKTSLPFPYSDEVWTGIEYQVASHLMMNGMVGQGLEIVRLARKRYDGRFRNPFDEYECGHWYARAMSSYALIQGLTGVRYDAVEQALYIEPSIEGDFRSFLSTASGYGTAGVQDGQPFIEIRHGNIPVRRVHYKPASGAD